MYKVPKRYTEQLWFRSQKTNAKKVCLLSVVRCRTRVSMIYFSVSELVRNRADFWFISGVITFNNSYCEKLNLGVPNISWQNGWGGMRAGRFVCLNIGDSSSHSVCVCLCVCVQGLSMRLYVTWVFYFVAWELKCHMQANPMCTGVNVCVSSIRIPQGRESGAGEGGGWGGVSRWCVCVCVEPFGVLTWQRRRPTAVNALLRWSLIQ